MVDTHFGHWLAGFIDGEGCFYIAQLSGRPLGYSPRFSLAVREDDAPIVLECCRVTGLGSTHFYKAQSGSRVIRWIIQSRADCQGLVDLLRKYPLRAKKADDLEVWARAVTVAAQVKVGRGQDNTAVRAHLGLLKMELAAVRVKGLSG